MVVAGLLLAGCTPPDDDPGLRVVGEPGSAFVSASNVQPGQPVSFGSIILCLERSGEATVRGIGLIDLQGSIKLDSFGVRPNPFARGEPGIGAIRDHLADLGFDDPAQVVDTTCPGPGEIESWTGGSELAVEMSHSDPTASSWVGSLEVSYAFGVSGRGTFTIPYGIGLCPNACPDPFPPTEPRVGSDPEAPSLLP